MKKLNFFCGDKSTNAIETIRITKIRYSNMSVRAALRVRLSAADITAYKLSYTN